MAPKIPSIVLPPGCTSSSLLPVQQLLHLAAYRNKNQHRVAKWWASFSILRRQVGKLIAALEDPNAMFRVNKVEIEKRVVFLREEVVPRCYLAFSAVVADNQYASLGLMLMGCLARLNKLISFPNKEDVEINEAVDVEKTASNHVLSTEDLGEAVSREELEGLVKAKSLDTPKRGSRSGDELEVETISSLGWKGLLVSTAAKEVITKTVGISDGDNSASPAPERTTTQQKRKQVVETTVTTTSTKITAPKPSRKKRKKGGDEFDELFSGLI